ncbi:uncharacterized protein LY89DRAFT_733392 [Mollisia scopiformis]|uniref:DUF6604 domain-containing protein n=1 Tax=Mollisia scopiformis TaxID=149040 RepID=A0A194XBK8_MOLSC|nr:uncharacterized protein LY89DRAFT_733392 [Mollisia scopiformis]KUJ17549.1 hypothetical protein LY89DRAFT_733392 [Mollisia scopiformis]
MTSTLPDTLSQTYQRYKEDTKTIVTWLSNEANTSGYKLPIHIATPPAISTGRAKGKDRKLVRTQDASASPAIKLPTFILVEQAKWLANGKPKVKVPVYIHSSLERAIRARQRCSNWFMSNSPTDDEGAENTKAHIHFINCLIQIRDVLRPFFEIPDLKPRSLRSSTTSSPLTSLNNSFQALKVSDINDETLDSLAIEPAATVKTGQQPKKANAREYELERGEDEDLTFRIFCFFEDLHRIQDVLKEAWQRCHQKTLDSSVAALMTDVAINMVEKWEADLVTLAHGRLDRCDHTQYFRFFTQLFPTGDSVAHPENLGHGTDWAYIWEFLMLQKEVAFTPQRNPAFTRSIFPEPLTSMPQYASKKDEDLFMNRMNLDISSFKVNKGVQFLELEILDNRSAGNKPGFPRRYYGYLDGITKTMCKTENDVITVFASRLLLDANHILGASVKGFYEDLRRDGASALQILDFDHYHQGLLKHRAGYDQSIRDGLELAWGSDEAVRQATGAFSMIRCGIKTNLVATRKKACMKNWAIPSGSSSPSEVDQILIQTWPSKDPIFFYNHNPIYCGMESLRLAVTMHKTGILLSNGIYAFVAMAHVYNLVNQNELLAAPWTDMEQAMERFKSELFHGSYPMKLDEIVRRYGLCFGIKASNFARNARKKVLARTIKRVEPLKESPISACLEAYLAGNESAERFLHSINKFKNLEPSPTKSSNLIDMFDGLRDVVQEALPQIREDLICLNRQCDILLRRIWDKLQAELDVDFGGGSNVTCFYIGSAVLSNVCGHITDRSPNFERSGAPFQRKTVEITAIVVQEFIKELAVADKKAVEPFSIDEVTRDSDD